MFLNDWVNLFILVYKNFKWYKFCDIEKGLGILLMERSLYNGFELIFILFFTMLYFY